MKYILKISMSLIFLTGISANAQTDWQWASGGGAASGASLNYEDERVRDIAVDRNGNSYVVSYINVSNPGIAGNPVTVYSDTYYNDIALAAFDCSGNYLWSKIIGSFTDDWVQGVEVDTLGHVYIAGKVKPAYQSASTKPVNFSTDTIIPYSSNDNLYKKTIFLAQYDTQGNLQWLRMPQADGLATFDARNIVSQDLSVSPSGEIYWLVNIRPGTYANGAFVNNTPDKSMYVFHYDVNGVFQEAIPMDFDMRAGKFSDFDWERDHHSGRFYVCGYYPYYNDDEPDPVLGNNVVTHSMYTGAFDAQGNFLWMHENTETYTNPDFNGFAVGVMKALAVDHQGNIYLSGESTDGDFFAGGEIVSQPLPPPYPPGYYSEVPFVIKLDPAGNLLWINNADHAGLGAPNGNIAVNGKNVGITGGYNDIKWGNVDIENQPNTGGRAYLIQLDKNTGNFVSLDSITNVQNAELIGTALTADARENYYVGGMFGGTLTTGSQQVTSNGGPSDFFVAKFGENNCNCVLPEAAFTYQTDGQNGVSFTYTGTGNYDELEWGFGDGSISASASPTYTYTEDGVYWVCVTVYDNCGYDTYCQEVDTTLDTDVFEKLKIQVYPNPAGERVFVSTQTTLDYILYDLSGQKIKTGQLKEGETAIDLNGFSEGLYLLQVQNKNGRAMTIKLIKE